MLRQIVKNQFVKSQFVKNQLVKFTKTVNWSKVNLSKSQLVKQLTHQKALLVKTYREREESHPRDTSIYPFMASQTNLKEKMPLYRISNRKVSEGL